MARVVQVLLLLFVLGFHHKVRGQDEDGLAEEGEHICANRVGEEWFRLSMEDCRTVYQCTSSGVQTIRCPAGLVFDIVKQACSWPEQVKNCAQKEKPPIVKPLLVTDVPLCEDNMLACGDGLCMGRDLFCDGKPNCQDGSDETLCDAEHDPNRAPECDPSECQPPGCFCSRDGKGVPGNLKPSTIPQMIMLTFDGSININNIDLYNRIFHGSIRNPNGCTMKATFFVSHTYTNYSAVQHFHALGHEIAITPIANEDQRYWESANLKEWDITIRDLKKILELYASIEGSVYGVRAPFLNPGGNEQILGMVLQEMLYDSTVTVPLQDPPVWPYNLAYRIPHPCHSDEKCPTRSFDIWEMAMNELDRRDSKFSVDRLSGCTMVDSCSNIATGRQLYHFLDRNFLRHYETNRAPFGLPFHAAWLKNNPGLLEVFLLWIDDIQKKYDDVYFVSMKQVLDWIRDPHTTEEMDSFEAWKYKCDPEVTAACKPKGCTLTTKFSPGESYQLYTCSQCPNFYPWVADPSGNGGYIYSKSNF